MGMKKEGQMNNIFIGNLAFTAKAEDVQKLFEECGPVESVTITTKKGGKSRGFGFLKMENYEDVKTAIEKLDGREFMGRPLKVTAVVPKGAVQHAEKFPSKKPWEPRENSDFDKRPNPRPYRSDNDRSKPWQKREGTAKPYRRPDERTQEWTTSKGESKPYRKFSGPAGSSGKPYSKPWEKRDGDAKPYRKFSGNSSSSGRPPGKPWEKREGGGRPAGKPWEKRDGDAKPYRKFSGSSGSSARPAGKPWEKRESSAKPFLKSVAQSSKLTRKIGEGFRSRPKNA